MFKTKIPANIFIVIFSIICLAMVFGSGKAYATAATDGAMDSQPVNGGEVANSEIPASNLDVDKNLSVESSASAESSDTTGSSGTVQTFGADTSSTIVDNLTAPPEVDNLTAPPESIAQSDSQISPCGGANSCVDDGAAGGAILAVQLAPDLTNGLDTNGDGKSEVGVLYDYGSSNSGLWFFSPTLSGYSAPNMSWYSGAGNWEWSRSKMAVLDTNGDARSELAVLYDYENANAGLFIFNPVTGYTPSRVWYSGAGNWDWSRSKVTSMDRDGNGISELAVLYDYGGASTGLFLFDPVTGYAPSRVWHSGAGNWNWNRSKITATDQDGDGISELTILYDYDSATAGIFIIDPTSNPAYTPSMVWYSGYGNWGWGSSMLTAVDNDGDGKSELAVLYDYGRNDAGLWLFDTTESGYAAPGLVWYSGAGNWGWIRSKTVKAEVFEWKVMMSLETLRRMADWLNAQAGKPYIWGAGHPPNPNLGGYDCSGLVSSVLQLIGIPISGTTYDIIYQVRFISESAARQAPLVIVFNSDISHMGIGILGQWWEATPPVVLGPSSASNYWDIYAVPAIVSSGIFGAGGLRLRRRVKLLMEFWRRRKSL